MRARVYGHGRGHGSWSVVTAGLAEGLRAHDLLGGVHHVDEETNELGDEPVAICVGSPDGWERALHYGEHRERWVVLAPNSTWLPRGVVDRLGLVATRVIAPSAWAAEVLRGHTFLPVMVVGHGVTAALLIRSTWGSRRSDVFRVLHMTTTDRQRKGTAELLEAWREFHRAVPASELTVVSDFGGGDLLPAGVVWRRRVDLPPLEVAQFYRQFQCVCQPSRAEGFGMVPLEALAVGVPVAATIMTGHHEYLRAAGHYMPGVALVPSGRLGPIDDGPGALAPTVDPGDVLRALLTLRLRWDTFARAASINARRVVEEWSWGAVAERYGLARAVKEVT